MDWIYYTDLVIYLSKRRIARFIINFYFMKIIKLISNLLNSVLEEEI